MQISKYGARSMNMFNRGLVARIKESLSIWRAFSPKNSDFDDSELVLGMEGDGYQRLEYRLKRIS